jgi:hypothetical protein
MGFEGWRHRFQGPVPLPEYLKPKAGVFIVWCVHDGIWDMLDVGDADNVRNFLLIRAHDQDQGGDQPYRIYYSAAYVAELEERIRLLKSIKGPSFIPCDLAALRDRKETSEHEKLFGHAKSRRFLSRRLAKFAGVPALPRRLMRGLIRRTKELETKTKE